MGIWYSEDLVWHVVNQVADGQEFVIFYLSLLHYKEQNQEGAWKLCQMRQMYRCQEDLQKVNCIHIPCDWTTFCDSFYKVCLLVISNKRATAYQIICCYFLVTKFNSHLPLVVADVPLEKVLQYCPHFLIWLFLKYFFITGERLLSNTANTTNNSL